MTPDPDRAAPTGPGGDPPSAGERYSAISVTLAIAGLVGTVVNTSVTVAVAEISRDLGEPLGHTGVAILLLNVSMAFLMPPAGLVAGRIGARETLIAAGVLVVASSLLLSSAHDLAMVGAGRVLQGAGLAAILPTAVQASTSALHGELRGRALGWWAAANGLGLAAAPLVGGVLIDTWGWRFVTLPSIVLGIALAVSATAAFPGRLRNRSAVPLRGVAGLAAVAGTAIGLLAALSASAWGVTAIATVGLVAAVVAVGRTISRSDRLSGPVGWWRDRGVRRSSLGASVQMITNGVAQVGVPAWLVSQGRLSSAAAGALLLLMTVTMAGMGPVTGRLSRLAFDRWLAWGLRGCLLGLAIISFADALGPWWLVAIGLAVLGVSAGALLTPSLAAFSGSIAGGDAVGLALFNVLRLGSFGVGGLLGAAAVGAGRPWIAFAAAAAASGLAAASRPRPQS